MKIAVLLVALIACAYALSEREYTLAFDKYKVQYNKQYATEAEHRHRLSVFRSNLDFINSHDAEAKGVFTRVLYCTNFFKGFTVAVNEFADQTLEEFSNWACGMNITKRIATVAVTQPDASAPASWDWRSKGAVTGIKNQGQCGSCAFVCLRHH